MVLEAIGEDYMRKQKAEQEKKAMQSRTQSSSSAVLWIVGVAVLLLAALFVAGVSRAFAKDLALTEQDQQNWAFVPELMERCTSSASLRGDTGPCRQLYPFLAGFAERVKAAADKPVDEKKEGDK